MSAEEDWAAIFTPPEWIVIFIKVLKVEFILRFLNLLFRPNFPNYLLKVYRLSFNLLPISGHLSSHSGEEDAISVNTSIYRSSNCPIKLWHAHDTWSPKLFRLFRQSPINKSNKCLCAKIHNRVSSHCTPNAASFQPIFRHSLVGDRPPWLDGFCSAEVVLSIGRTLVEQDSSGGPLKKWNRLRVRNDWWWFWVLAAGPIITGCW